MDEYIEEQLSLEKQVRVSLEDQLDMHILLFNQTEDPDFRFHYQSAIYNLQLEYSNLFGELYRTEDIEMSKWC